MINGNHLAFLPLFAHMIARFFTWLCVRWFRATGWQIPKSIPADLGSYVMVVAPHTSNIDFFVGVAARSEMKIDVKYLAKKELFTFPVKKLLLNLGGYPVDRSKNTSLVDAIVDIYKAHDYFAMCVAAEGTRSKVETFKTGFYHIARKAEVPIVMVGFDYDKKWIVASEPFHPTGDIDSDMERMFKFFRKIAAKRPENFGL